MLRRRRDLTLLGLITAAFAALAWGVELGAISADTLLVAPLLVLGMFVVFFPAYGGGPS